VCCWPLLRRHAAEPCSRKGKHLTYFMCFFLKWKPDGSEQIENDLWITIVVFFINPGPAFLLNILSKREAYFNEDKHKLLLDFLSLLHMCKIKIIFKWLVKHKKHFTKFSEAWGDFYFFERGAYEKTQTTQKQEKDWLSVGRWAD